MTELEALRRENADLRARLRLDEALVSDLTRYREMIAALAEGIVLQDDQGRIVTCNAAAESILGLTADQMAGRNSIDPRWRAIHEDGSPFTGTDHPAMVALRSGKPHQGVIMGVHRPSGELSWIRIHSQPLIREPGRPPYGVITTFVDITEQRAAEARLRSQAERFAFALGAARMGTWVWDISTGRVDWSDQVEAIFGLEARQFDRTFEGYLALIHPEDREAVADLIDNTVLDEGSAYEVVHRIIRPDGSQAWIQGAGKVFHDAMGRPSAMAGTVTDISAAKELEHRHRQAQRMETVGRLAGGIAHDFNNLLTAILGSVDLARLEGSLSSNVRLGLDTIQQSAVRAGRLTQQLLTFARRQVVDLETVELGELVRDSGSLLRRVLGTDVELSLLLPDDPVWIRADRSQIEQVVINLAVNARDAMPEGGTLRIRVAQHGDLATLEVSDTGTGVSPQAMEHLFEPFFTTKETGSGLGLATCYGIVTSLGGRIELRSAPGDTVFTVLLPALPRGEATASPPATTRTSDGTELVLLVEDEPMVAAVAERALTGLGYRVRVCGNAEEALAVLDALEAPVDLVVTDIVMPGMSGWKLAEQILQRFPGTPVLYMSGYSDDPAAHGVSPRHFLQKPFRPAMLGRRVREILDEASLRAAGPG